MELPLKVGDDVSNRLKKKMLLKNVYVLYSFFLVENN